MTNRNFADETDEKPLDPAVERVRKKLVRFVAINLGLLFIALMAVVLAVVYRARTANDGDVAIVTPPTSEVLTGAIALPAGARIVSQSFSGNRIAMDVELTGGGHTIFIYDIAEKRIVGRFDVKPE
ncbi:MAG TPA: fimbrial protein [Rhizobiaceae bacterium]|nr:fimbrial protein [Rhizobiaceae bacterium]